MGLDLHSQVVPQLLPLALQTQFGVELRAKTMAPWMKCPLQKPKDFIPDPQHPRKKTECGSTYLPPQLWETEMRFQGPSEPGQFGAFTEVTITMNQF